MKKVCEDHSPIIITRKGENLIAMMSLEDYQSIKETIYLLRSPANARQALESITDLESGNGVERDLIECHSRNDLDNIRSYSLSAT